MNRYVPYQDTPDSSRIVAGAINDILQRKRPIKTITATYTIDAKVEEVDTLLADATSAAITVNLPSAALYKGVEFTVKKVDASANAVTLDGAGAETIDGAATKALATQWKSYTIVSDGTQWLITAAV